MTNMIVFDVTFACCCAIFVNARKNKLFIQQISITNAEKHAKSSLNKIHKTDEFKSISVKKKDTMTTSFSLSFFVRLSCGDVVGRKEVDSRKRSEEKKRNYE